MSSAEPETFSIKNITVLGGLLFVALLLGEVVFNTQGADDQSAKKMDTLEDIAMRIQPVVSLEEMRASMAMASSSAAGAAEMSAEQMYQSACLACHNTGAAGAPKLGDVAAWAEREAKGLDMLVKAAIGGIGAMPARGGSQLTDDQIKMVVEYILAESK